MSSQEESKEHKSVSAEPKLQKLVPESLDEENMYLTSVKQETTQAGLEEYLEKLSFNMESKICIFLGKEFWLFDFKQKKWDLGSLIGQTIQSYVNLDKTDTPLDIKKKFEDQDKLDAMVQLVTEFPENCAISEMGKKIGHDSLGVLVSGGFSNGMIDSRVFTVKFD